MLIGRGKRRKTIKKYCLKNSIIIKAVVGNLCFNYFVFKNIFDSYFTARLRSFKPSLVNSNIEKETVRLFKAAPEKCRKRLDKQEEKMASVEDQE